MKNFKFYFTGILLSLTLFSCISNDDDGGTPAIINEEEVISTVQVLLTNTTTAAVTTLRYVDLNDGNDPQVTVSGNLNPNTYYAGSIQFLNETVSPADNITEEVEEESTDHQVLFEIGTSLDTTLTYENFDTDGNPLGTEIEILTGTASSGNLTVVLRHEPLKPNDGTLEGAGGATDAQGVFPLVIQ